MLAGGEDAIGDGGGFDSGADIVSAQDVGATKDGCCVGRSGGVEAVSHGRYVSVEERRQRWVLGEGAGEKAFAGGSGEDGQVESTETVEVGEEGVIFVKYFAEAEAGIEDNLVAGDAGGGGGFEAFG